MFSPQDANIPLQDEIGHYHWYRILEAEYIK